MASFLRLIKEGLAPFLRLIKGTIFFITFTFKAVLTKFTQVLGDYIANIDVYLWEMMPLIGAETVGSISSSTSNGK